MNESWIKLYSKFLNWGWYQDTNTKVVFLHCLLKANWKDSKYQGYDIPRGSFVTGRNKLSKELQMTEREIRTSLEHLKSTNEVTIKTTNKFSIISINNYEMYQRNDQQSANERPTTDHNIRYIDNYSNYYSYINNILKRNFFNRDLTDIEQEIVSCWLEEYKDYRKIEYAIKEAIVSNKKELRYVQGILKNIKNKSYEELFTKEETQEEIEVFDYDWLNGEEQ